MDTDIRITDMRTLCEKRERLKLEAKYHRLGIEMHLSKGLSFTSIAKAVTDRISGDGGQGPKNGGGTFSGNPMSPSFGVWGIAVPLVAKIISTKISTGKTWTEVLAHVVRSALKKFGIG